MKGGLHGKAVWEETEGCEGVLKHDGLEVFGEFPVSLSQEKAEFFAGRWVVVDSREGFSKP